MAPMPIVPRIPLHKLRQLLIFSTPRQDSPVDQRMPEPGNQHSFRTNHEKNSQNFCPNFSHSEFCGKGVQTQSSPSPSIGVSSSPFTPTFPSDTIIVEAAEADETRRVDSRSCCSRSSDESGAWSFASARSRRYASRGTSQNDAEEVKRERVVFGAGILRVHLF
jgi:hypothetical protein